MAKKSGKYESIPFIGYIDIKLDKAGKAECAAFVQATTSAWALIDEYCENGYRISVAWDERSNCFKCSITCTDAKNDNAGYVLVGRGSHSEGAVLQAIYKERYVAQGRWKNQAPQFTNDWE